MDRRRSFSWLWVVVTIVLLVVVGAIAYFVGMNQGGAGHHVGFLRPFHPFAGMHGLFGARDFGWWVPILLLALAVGVIVALIARPSARTETYEEWHRRQHQPASPEPTSAPVPGDQVSGGEAADREAGAQVGPPG